MMTTKLLNNFYSEMSSTFSADNQQNFSCTIELNSDHEIYKGHFEQVPIAPGVCLVQIVTEILMDKFQQNLILSEGKNLKYLGLINPKVTCVFQIDFLVNKTDTFIDATVNYHANGTTYTKMKLLFKRVAQ